MHANQDPAVELNNLLQNHETGNLTPQFHWVMDKEGKDHNAVHTATAMFRGQNVGQGSGTSKGAAKRDAAGKESIAAFLWFGRPNLALRLNNSMSLRPISSVTLNVDRQEATPSHIRITASTPVTVRLSDLLSEFPHPRRRRAVRGAQKLRGATITAARGPADLRNCETKPTTAETSSVWAAGAGSASGGAVVKSGRPCVMPAKVKVKNGAEGGLAVWRRSELVYCAYSYLNCQYRLVHGLDRPQVKYRRNSRPRTNSGLRLNYNSRVRCQAVKGTRDSAEAANRAQMPEGISLSAPNLAAVNGARLRLSRSPA
ncbi:hypothetical protein BJV78DRAFT_1156239 [Lactifluus subvellereus]|nr:hypothetical protein BJV78DRAFT_1156239 [Lactifluus subvellereus]